MTTPDKFRIRLEDDGTITVVTDRISPEQHFSAEEFIKWSAQQVGGAWEQQKRSEAHTHEHEHAHAHGHAHVHTKEGA